jgi:hypothetical protein
MPENTRGGPFVGDFEHLARLRFDNVDDGGLGPVACGVFDIHLKADLQLFFTLPEI